MQGSMLPISPEYHLLRLRGKNFQTSSNSSLALCSIISSAPTRLKKSACNSVSCWTKWEVEHIFETSKAYMRSFAQNTHRLLRQQLFLLLFLLSQLPIILYHVTNQCFMPLPSYELIQILRKYQRAHKRLKKHVELYFSKIARYRGAKTRVERDLEVDLRVGSVEATTCQSEAGGGSRI